MRVVPLLTGCLVVAAAATARPAYASCGIDACPIVLGARDANLDLTLQASVRFAGFSSALGDGTYFQYLARTEYRGFDGWILGAMLPVTTLLLDGERRLGLSNALLYGEWLWPAHADWTIGVGTQLELPVGDRAGGLADDHLDAMGYGRVRYTSGALFAFVRAGYRRSLAGSDPSHLDTSQSGLRPGHFVGAGGAVHSMPVHRTSATPVDQQEASAAVTPVYVEPHGSAELLYRAGVGGQFLAGELQASAYVDGVEVLEGGADIGSNTIIQIGAESVLTISKLFDVTVAGVIPLTRLRRHDWRGEFGLRMLF